MKKVATNSRKPSAERREEIVNAVLRIIGERGLTSLTTTTLAEEVGVTTGALFRHFDSREEIYREVMRVALARLEATFPSPELPPLKRIIKLASNRVKLLGQDAGLAWLLRSGQAYLTLPHDAVEDLAGMAKRSKTFLLEALLEGVACGEIRADIPAEVLLVPLMGTIHALIGMPGVHGKAAKTQGPSADTVLAALAEMLAPPRAGVAST